MGSNRKLFRFVIAAIMVLALACLLGCGWFDLFGGKAKTTTKYYATSETSNNRVLIYDAPFSTDENASVVLGQADFNHGTSNRGGSPAQNTLSSPQQVAVDSSGNLWVADWDNSRVLEFTPPFTNGMNASLVLGQSSFTTRTTGGGQSGLADPNGVAFDSSGNLWVADWGNNRVLEFAPPFSSGMNASKVLGQPDFTTYTANTTQSAMKTPLSLTFDRSGNLWVADEGNARVLEFVGPFSNGMNASVVLGQAGFNTANHGDTQNTFGWPGNMKADSSGNLWVSDNGNNRVLEFASPFTNGMNATLVLGQTNFTSNSCALTQSGLCEPLGLAFDTSGNLLVDDFDYSRVMVFSPPFANGMNATTVLGQPNFTSGSANQGGSPGANTLYYPLYGFTF